MAICALQGMAGVGKTYLAERFAWEHAGAFPGGVLRLAMRPDEAPTAASLLDKLAALLEAPAARPAELRGRLRAAKVLVHVDNADDRAAAEAAAGLAAELHGCALIVTGRYGPLGDDGEWTLVRVAPFDEGTALEQLAGELRRPLRANERDAAARLAGELGCLPLALSLAAAHLRSGMSPDDFLERLRDDNLDLDHPTPAPREPDRRRRNIGKALALSLELLRRTLGPRGEALVEAFHAFGHAPGAGVGVSLAAAMTGLSRADFLRVATAAVNLSVLDLAASEPPRWRMHPLLAQLVRQRAAEATVLARMIEWFVARLPRESKIDPRPMGERWTEVNGETAALVDVLARIPAERMSEMRRAGSRYARRAGPFATWSTLCERILVVHEDSLVRSNTLWTLGNVAQRAGYLDRALEVAQEKARLDVEAGREHGAALATGLRADILEARGQLDEALRIRQKDLLPVFEKLGDIRSRAVTMGKIADILEARGQLDEALRIRQHDLLPVYEELGDSRERAITLGKVADILETRGQLDEALRIHQYDELPVLEKLGDIRSRAVTMGKIADILEARGQLDEALRIRQQDLLPVFEKLGDIRHRAVIMGRIADILEARGKLDEALRIRQQDELPVYEKLGAQRDVLVCQAETGLTLLARKRPGDREEAGRLLRLALATADEMRLPEAEKIRSILRENGFNE